MLNSHMGNPLLDAAFTLFAMDCEGEFDEEEDEEDGV